MPKKANKSGRVPTFIAGLDKHISGGLVEHSVNLVAGGPGAGKTALALHFLYNGVVKHKEPGLYISFEQKAETVMEDAMGFGMNFAPLVEKGMCRFLKCNMLEDPGLQKKIMRILSKYKIKRAVIDSVSELSIALNQDSYRLRKELYLLTSFFRKRGITVVLTSEIQGEPSLDSSGGGKLSRDGIIEFVADCVFTLHNSGIGGKGDRALRVLKMRRTGHTKGPIPMSLSHKGMKVLQ